MREPPAGISPGIWESILDSILHFEGNPNYGYGCPSHCCNPAVQDCRSIASLTLAQWVSQFGLVGGINVYNTGNPYSGYGPDVVAHALAQPDSAVGPQPQQAVLTPSQWWQANQPWAGVVLGLFVLAILYSQGGTVGTFGALGLLGLALVFLAYLGRSGKIDKLFQPQRWGL